MSMVAVAASVAAAAAASSAGYAMSGAGEPSQPNLAASSAQLANIEAEMLPIERQLTAAANQGTSTTVAMPAHITTQQQVYIPGAGGAAGQWIPYDPSQFQPGGQYASISKPQIRTQNVHVPAGDQTFNFTGMGSAEVQSELAQQLAAVRLSLQAQYGPQFIAQAASEEQQAEPQQVAARGQEFGELEKQLATPFVQPAANVMDRQVQQELQAAQANKLDPAMMSLLTSGGQAADAAREGGSNPPANFEQPLTSGFAGEAQQLGAIQAAMGELTSGSDPQDIAYRHQQQEIGNVGAFANSQTPEAQFQSLSGAQQGAAPFNPGQSLPEMPGNEAGAGGAALSGFQSQLQESENQMAPWLGGVSSTLGLTNALAGMQANANNQNNFNQLLQSLQGGGQQSNLG